LELIVISGRNNAVKKSHRAVIILAVGALFGIYLFCLVTEGRENVTPTSSDTAGEANTSQTLTEEEISALKWLANKDSEKAEALKQALEQLREEDPEKIRQEEIDNALKWLEKEDPKKSEALKQLREKDSEEFEAELRRAIEAEIQKSLKQRFRGMVKGMIFGIVGGLGLFLFGMGLLSDGLKKVAGQKLKGLLELLTKNRVIAALIGALTTSFIQSSSATTVMMVGFVNAGLLSLKQALSVVLGANVGTTFTAWLVSTLGIGEFKITLYSLPAIGVGFLLKIMGKTQKARSVGTILLGFGLLFLGMSFMQEAFAPLKDNEGVQSALIWLGGKPILAVLAGAVMTMLLQSSSATIMIIQVLAFQGAFGMDWELAVQVAIPFILGDNIGTTITAELAALQTSRNSKRVAKGHTMFNVVGVIYMFPFVYTGLFAKVVGMITPWELSQSTIMAELAFAHSMFNVFNAIVFTFAIGWLEVIVMKILPVTEAELARRPVVLERRLLTTPVIALGQAKREIVRMAKTAKKAFENCVNGIVEDDRRRLESVRQLEDYIDEFQYEITSYSSASATMPKILLKSLNEKSSKSFCLATTHSPRLTN